MRRWGERGDLDDETELDALMNHAFDRYFETSGLFSTTLMIVCRMVGASRIRRSRRNRLSFN